MCEQSRERLHTVALQNQFCRLASPSQFILPWLSFSQVDVYLFLRKKKKKKLQMAERMEQNGVEFLGPSVGLPPSCRAQFTGHTHVGFPAVSTGRKRQVSFPRLVGYREMGLPSSSRKSPRMVTKRLLTDQYVVVEITY